MKYVFLFINLFLFAISYSQSYKVDYIRLTINDYDEGVNLINTTSLFFNNDKSVFIEDKVINGHSTELSIEDYKADRLGNNIIGDSLGQVVIKYLDKGIYRQRKKAVDYRNTPYINVKDSILPDFNWVLHNDYKTVLDYNTQKATSIYMDRKITAWFTEEISIPDGPWKFSNLPGLILEVTIDYTQDMRVKYEAITLKKVNSLPIIELPKTRSESLKVIEEKYISKYNNIYKYYKTKSNGQINLRKDDLDFKPIIFNDN